MNETPYVLAVDSGGSKCEALLVQRDGTALQFHNAMRPGVGGRSPGLIEETIRLLAGATPPTDITLVMVGKAPRWPGPTIRIDEIASALRLSGETAGLVAIAGTGARVQGVTRDGREVNLDGYGPVLGDRGGGYQIGLQALRVTMRVREHPRHATLLAEKVLASLGLTPKTLIEFSLKQHDRSVFAALARLVDDVARAGDPIATAILKNAATDLAETTRDAVDRLGIAADTYPLIGIGSVAKKSDIYWQEYCRLVLAFAPHLKPHRPALPPVVGVAIAGLPPASKDRLFATVPTILKS